MLICLSLSGDFFLSSDCTVSDRAFPFLSDENAQADDGGVEAYIEKRALGILKNPDNKFLVS